MLDAVWLCKVAERQMLRPSFVPPRPIRVLRDLTRYRIDLVAARTAEKNRVEKLLEDACIKLSVVASDIFGVSGRAMLAALIAGERDPSFPPLLPFFHFLLFPILLPNIHLSLKKQATITTNVESARVNGKQRIFIQQ